MSQTAPNPVTGSSVRSDYVRYDKYEVVRRFLAGRRGALLDVGARNRILAECIDLKNIQYASADMEPGHDFLLNLEQPLAVEDQRFDYVIALDVLEHVENIDRAFLELARITRQALIIALPNMASLRRRFSYLTRASLGTDKYRLHAAHPGDRHRWVTTYDEMNAFVEANAGQAGFKVESRFEEIEVGYRPHRILSAVAQRLAQRGLVPQGLVTGRCTYILTRLNSGRVQA